MAGGAAVAGVDVLGAQAGGLELGAIGFAEVEEDAFGRGLVARGHHVEPLDGIGLVAGAEFVEIVGSVGELGEEFGGELDPDFVAAGADAGADGGEDIAGVCAEVHPHSADGFCGDAGEGAAPTGVDGGYGTLLGVDDKDGDAIGGLNGEEEAGAVGDGSVAAARSCGGGRVVNMDHIGVDLL